MRVICEVGADTGQEANRTATRVGSSELYALALTPRAGLSNKLFVWARALAWASANGAELLPTIWRQVRVGPLLRGERDSKFYGDIFNRSSVAQLLRREWIRRSRARRRESGHMLFDTQGAGVYEFSGLRSFFRGLEASRSLIVSELLANCRPYICDRYFSANKPEVAVHIRRGDFLENGMAVPQSWFIEAISAVRRAAAEECKITVFTDALPGQLALVTDMVDVEVFDSGNALIDLLVMSRSKFLVATGTSSFSAWASFLGGVPSLAQQGASLAKWELEDPNIPHLEFTNPSDMHLRKQLHYLLADNGSDVDK
jgi:Glycosyl transferase family 11